MRALNEMEGALERADEREDERFRWMEVNRLDSV